MLDAIQILFAVCKYRVQFIFTLALFSFLLI